MLESFFFAAFVSDDASFRLFLVFIYASSGFLAVHAR